MRRVRAAGDNCNAELQAQYRPDEESDLARWTTRSKAWTSWSARVKGCALWQVPALGRTDALLTRLES